MNRHKEMDAHRMKDIQIKQAVALNDALVQGAQYLRDCGIEDAQTDAWLLLEYVTGITRTAFLADRRQRMREEDYAHYEALLRKRASHIPLQHLTGEQEFMGLSFRVSRHVLIPRQDTETLAEEALARLKPGMRVLDLCTGSGCIAVSLAKLGPQAKSREDSFVRVSVQEKEEKTGQRTVKPLFCVDGADISPEALAVAKENGERLEAPVRWICSDLFAGIPDVYDMIVSNPPYIRTAVIEELSEEVRLHEPYQALDGKEDGLYFYRRIVGESREHLKPGGHLLFEIGYDQGTEVPKLMAEAGFEAVCVLRDLAGKDRVAAGIWPGAKRQPE